MEKWEDEFIEELNNVPLLSSVDLIKCASYFAQFLRNIKKKTSQPTDAGTSVHTVPLFVVELGDAPQALAEEAP
ncbi:hypothetical protein CR513_25232, partial [Mucuna pruriens]